MKLSVIAFRNIRRNSRRSLLSGLAIALATMVIVLMFSLIAGIKVDLSRNIFTYDTGHIRIRHEDYAKYETLQPLHLGVARHREVSELIRQDENVQTVLPRIRFPSAIYYNETNYSGLGMGLDFYGEIAYNHEKNGSTGTLSKDAYLQMDPTERLKELAKAWALEGFSGELPEEGSKELLLGYSLANKMGVGVGDKITLYTKTAFFGLQAWTYRITGIVQFPLLAMNDKFFLLPVDSVQKFLKMDQQNDSMLELIVYVDDQKELDDTAERMRAAFDTGGFTELDIRTWRQVGAFYAWVEIAETVYNIAAIIFFLLGSTVIINTTIMVIYERMKEIGTIAAMGMTGGQIVKLFFLEAMFISTISALAGTLLGIGITIPLSIYGLNFEAAMEGLDFPLSPSFYPILTWKSTIFVLIYSIVVASLASFVPTRKAAKIEPVEALRAL